MLRLNVFSQLDSKRLGFRGGYMAQKGKKGRIFGENPAGFTLVEILLVFGVLIVISLYASVALVGFFRTTQLETSTDAIVELATHARGNAVEGEQFTKWGISVVNLAGAQAYVSLFFCEDDPCTNRTEINRYVLPALVRFVVPGEDSTDVITFNRRDGTVEDGKTHYLVLSNGSTTRVITFYSNGSIQRSDEGQSVSEENPGSGIVLSEAYANGGIYSDAALAADGLPIFSHRSDSGALLVTKCLIPDCSQTQTIQPGAQAAESEIIILPSGNPFLSFPDPSSLSIISCDDSLCTPPEQAITVQPWDFSYQYGWFVSMAVGSDGFPVITHLKRQGFDFRLVVTHCLNVACDSAETHDIGQAGIVTPYGLAITISNGLPLIVFSNGVLNMLACDDAACDPAEGGPDPIYAGNPDYDAWHISVTTGYLDGLPIIAYGTSGMDIRVTRCASFDCSTISSEVRVMCGGFDIGGDIWGVHKNITVAAGDDGNPAIAYKRADYAPGMLGLPGVRPANAGGGGGGCGGGGINPDTCAGDENDSGRGGIWYMKCLTPNCENEDTQTAAVEHAEIFTDDSVDSHLSMVLRAGNLPSIGLRALSPSSSFMIASCGNLFCQ